MTNIIQQNGETVIEALKDLREPSTLTEVVQYIAETEQLIASKIKSQVKETLENGVRFGFIYKIGGKYSRELSWPRREIKMLENGSVKVDFNNKPKSREDDELIVYSDSELDEVKLESQTARKRVTRRKSRRKTGKKRIISLLGDSKLNGSAPNKKRRKNCEY